MENDIIIYVALAKHLKCNVSELEMVNGKIYKNSEQVGVISSLNSYIQENKEETSYNYTMKFTPIVKSVNLKVKIEKTK